MRRDGIGEQHSRATFGIEVEHGLRGKIDVNLPEDMVEFHVVRNGVDQEAIKRLFEEVGFNCEITRYFTTTNLLTKHLGRKLDVKNSFSVLAYRS